MPDAGQPNGDPSLFATAFTDQNIQQAGQALASGSPQAVQQFASQVQTWADSAAQMKAVAVQGGFAVDPKGGQAYVDLYNRCIDKIESLRLDIRNIVRTYQLGTSPGAQKIAPWNLQVAQELEAAFNQLPTVYANARDAYAQAMKNYDENEHNVSDILRKAARG